MDKDLTDAIPETIVLNGINARSEKFAYSLQFKPKEIQDIFVNGRTVLIKDRHKELMEERAFELESGHYAILMSGKDENNLADTGWGVIFPAETKLPVDQILEALQPLLQKRREEAGELYHVYRGANGIFPNDTAAMFMERHNSSAGVVDPTPENLPFYLLLVGSPLEIPFSFQYELGATFLVGRIYFGNDPDPYFQYARSVSEAEKNGVKLARRAVFFGPSHAGDAATQASATMLVKPVAEKLDKSLNRKRKLWDIEYLAPELCKRSKLESLLGRADQQHPKGDAPAFLFTASHGMVFPKGDPEQRDLQGAILCQDLESTQSLLQRGHYLGSPDIGDDFNLHGLIAFHFACFGAGTPALDNFAKPGQLPAEIAPQDFLSALPQRLLTHPRGGALAVVGHIDRAWTYSFKWRSAGEQTQTFESTLTALLFGSRLGLALDQFAQRYAQLSVRVSNWYDQAQVRKPTQIDLLRDWTANNDARGYALLGDPAIRLAVPDENESAIERAALEITSFEAKGNGSSFGPSSLPEKPAAPPGFGPALPPAPPRTTPERQSPSSIDPTPGALPVSGVVIYNQQGGTINLNTQLVQRRSAAPERGDSEADFASLPELFGGRPKTEAANQQEDPLAQTRNKLAAFLDSLAQKVDDLATLEVNTYVSSDIANVKPDKGKLTGDLQPRARTVMKLDGDTEIVIPSADDGGIDRDVWEIHDRTFHQAQEWRKSLIEALSNLISGLIPGK